MMARLVIAIVAGLALALLSKMDYDMAERRARAMGGCVEYSVLYRHFMPVPCEDTD